MTSSSGTPTRVSYPSPVLSQLSSSESRYPGVQSRQAWFWCPAIYAGRMAWSTLLGSSPKGCPVGRHPAKKRKGSKKERSKTDPPPEGVVNKNSPLSGVQVFSSQLVRAGAPSQLRVSSTCALNLTAIPSPSADMPYLRSFTTRKVMKTASP